MSKATELKTAADLNASFQAAPRPNGSSMGSAPWPATWAASLIAPGAKSGVQTFLIRKRAFCLKGSSFTKKHVPPAMNSLDTSRSIARAWVCRAGVFGEEFYNDMAVSTRRQNLPNRPLFEAILRLDGHTEP